MRNAFVDAARCPPDSGRSRTAVEGRDPVASGSMGHHRARAADPGAFQRLGLLSPSARMKVSISVAVRLLPEGAVLRVAMET